MIMATGVILFLSGLNSCVACLRVVQIAVVLISGLWEMVLNWEESIIYF